MRREFVTDIASERSLLSKRAMMGARSDETGLRGSKSHAKP
jgi:hypothetical protein